MQTTVMPAGLEERTHAIPCFTKAGDQYMLSIAFVLSFLNVCVKIIVGSHAFSLLAKLDRRKRESVW